MAGIAFHLRKADSNLTGWWSSFLQIFKGRLDFASLEVDESIEVSLDSRFKEPIKDV